MDELDRGLDQMLDKRDPHIDMLSVECPLVLLVVVLFRACANWREAEDPEDEGRAEGTGRTVFVVEEAAEWRWERNCVGS